ncbi:unannotated protein [freshwater metagenome]|uniref:Unannotated protein n=1 Tax=freshwater metagenome TaxID=449393 RepID=A0A6J7C694_9ZZZZ
MTQCSAPDLQKLLGKGKMNAMIRHPWFQEYRNYEHAYKHGISRSGFTQVEVYPFFREVHTNANGKIRPTAMLQFTFSYGGFKVVQVEKYYRDKEPDENEKRLGPSAGWKHLKTWSKEENAVEKAWNKHNMTEADEAGSTLYHVTKTINVPNIQQHGITGMNPTNFKKASGGQYGNIGEIFCMTSKKDAIRWAAKWEWQLLSKMGTGAVSVVSFTDDPRTWQKDDSDPLGQAGNEGQWLKKHNVHVSPEQIIGAEPVTIDMIKGARV